jgi:hypothetical protein
MKMTFVFENDLTDRLKTQAARHGMTYLSIITQATARAVERLEATEPVLSTLESSKGGEK